jgi:hypothetical protein
VRDSEAAKPAAEVSAHGPRGSNRLGNQIATEAKRPIAKNQDAHGSLTTLQAAFLGALVDMAQREAGDVSISPADDVAPHEIRRAIHALVRAKGEGCA